MAENVSVVKPERNSYAVISIVLGIFSMMTACCGGFLFPMCCLPISLLLAVVGLVLGILGMKSEQRTGALIGVILNGLALLLIIALFLLTVVFQVGAMMMAPVLDSVEDFMPEDYENFLPEDFLEQLEQLEEFQDLEEFIPETP